MSLLNSVVEKIFVGKKIFGGGWILPPLTPPKITPMRIKSKADDTNANWEFRIINQEKVFTLFFTFSRFICFNIMLLIRIGLQIKTDKWGMLTVQLLHDYQIVLITPIELWLIPTEATNIYHNSLIAVLNCSLLNLVELVTSDDKCRINKNLHV